MICDTKHDDKHCSREVKHIFKANKAKDVHLYLCSRCLENEKNTLRYRSGMFAEWFTEIKQSDKSKL